MASSRGRYLALRADVPVRGEADTASGGSGTATQGLRGLPSLPHYRTGCVQQDGFDRGATMSRDKTIQRILELSAEAHIARRRAPKDSPAFHALTGAIAAYGKVLTLLVAVETAGKNSPQLSDPLEAPQPEIDPQTASQSPFISSLFKQISVSSN